VQRVLTDWGTEYCGKPENYAYRLYLAVEDIDHSRTKANPTTLRLTASVSDSTKPYRMSAIASSSGRSGISPWKSYRWMWMSGSGSTMKNGLIRGGTATGRHPGKPSWAASG
jgi:hypothetical protein